MSTSISINLQRHTVWHCSSKQTAGTLRDENGRANFPRTRVQHVASGRGDRVRLHRASAMTFYRANKSNQSRRSPRKTNAHAYAHYTACTTDAFKAPRARGKSKRAGNADCLCVALRRC